MGLSPDFFPKFGGLVSEGGGLGGHLLSVGYGEHVVLLQIV